MKILIFLMLFLLAGFIHPQNEFQNFINHVNSLSSTDEKKNAVDSFMTYARIKGIPFIENTKANFIYRGTSSRVQLAGDMTGWSPYPQDFAKLIGTDFFYLTKEFERNARLDYKLIINSSQWILDPENPHRVSGGFGPNSELAMPDYIQPWEINYQVPILHGNVEFISFPSKIMNKNYSVKIYLPPDYQTSGKNYPSVYFQDGGEYILLGSAVNVIDNLIDSNKIEPPIAVFVTPTNRQIEYAESNRYNYSKFFAEELVPYIDSIYRTEKDPQRRVIIGDSWGGNISALISWQYPEIFSKCGLHSSAFWPNNYEVYNMIVNGDKKEISYFSVYGTYESLLDNMRSFHSKLKDKGYNIQSFEYPEGHSWGLWRANIDCILKYFLPKVTSVNDKNISPTGYNLYQNYPNPFNPGTTINYVLEKSGFVQIKIFDSLGKEVDTIVDTFQMAGFYSKYIEPDIRLSSGVYFYRMIADNFSETRKMIFLR